MADGLRVLLIEDSPADAALLLAELGRAGLVVECTRVVDESGFCEQLKLLWDLILADGRQPQFDATRALDCLHRSGLDLPFIVVSETVGEQVAAAAMLAGAHDYIFKHNLARLGPVIRRELRAASARRSMSAEGGPTAQLAAVEASPDPAYTQQALRQLASIVESSNDAIVSASLDGTVLSWNAAAERMYGYTAAEMIGQNILRLAPEGRSHETVDLMQEWAGDQQRHSFETVRRRKDGTLIDASITLSSIFDAAGRTVAFSGITRDITETKRGAAALLASEARYRQIVETAEEGIWLIDREDRTTFVNRRMAEMLGFSVEEMVGQPVYAFMDDAGRAEAAVQLQRRREGVAERIEFRLRQKNGRECWVLLSTSPILKADGTYDGALTMASDITKRKRDEAALVEQRELYENLLRAQSDLGEILMLSDNGRVVYVNEAFHRMIGLPAAEVPLDARLYDFVVPEERAALMERVGSALKAEGPHQFEATIRRRDGERVQLEIAELAFKTGGRLGADPRLRSCLE